MRNLLPSTISVGNVFWICWRPLPGPTKNNQPAIYYTTNSPTYNSLRFSQLAACSASVEISLAIKIIRVAMYRCSLKYGFLFSTSSRSIAISFPIQFSFSFVFNFVDILCVLLYTSIISLHVIKHVSFCDHYCHCKNK